jgi:hypothetical protein
MAMTMTLAPWPGCGQDPRTAVLCGQSGAEPWKSNLEEKDSWMAGNLVILSNKAFRRCSKDLRE